MKNFSAPLPLWARVVLLAGLIGIALGAGLVAYRYYSKLITLSSAVGSFDGEATKIASIIAGRLDAAKSAVRVNVVPTDSVLIPQGCLPPGRRTWPSFEPMSAISPRREASCRSTNRY